MNDDKEGSAGVGEGSDGSSGGRDQEGSAGVRGESRVGPVDKSFLAKLVEKIKKIFKFE